MPSDVYTHAGEGVAGALPHEQDVADARGFGVVFCEEAGSGAGGVEKGCLGVGYGCKRVGAGFFDVARCGFEDWDAELVACDIALALGVRMRGVC